MKILVVGAGGFLGSEIHSQLKKRHVVEGTAHSKASGDLLKFDITNAAEVNRIFLQDFDAIINTAAISDPKACEEDKILAYKTNVAGAKNLAEVCPQRTKLVYISSSSVFSGNGNFTEMDTPSPQNYYGETKLEGELATGKHPNSIIARTSWIFGYAKTDRNMAYQIISKLKAGQKVYAYANDFNRPTFSEDIGSALEKLMQADAGGVWHIAGSDLVSRYEFALKIAAKLDLPESLLQKSGLPAARNRSMNIDKISALYKTQSLEDSLSKLKAKFA